MQINKKIHQKIKALAAQGEVDLALAQCNALPPTDGEDHLNWLRLRAYLNNLKGDYASAMLDRESIIATDEAELKDLYHIADTALLLGRFREACEWFEKLLHRSETEKETWFVSSALVMTAYAQMKQGQYKEALASLNLAVERDPKCGMALPDGMFWDHNQLRAEINRLYKGSAR